MRFSIITLILLSSFEVAAQQRRNVRPAPRPQQQKQTPRAPAPVAPTAVSGKPAGLQQAQTMIRQGGQAVRALALLHQVVQRPDLSAYRLEAKYAMGLALLELKMDQLAAIQFVEVIRAGKSGFLKASIDRLSIAADRLGDETLLNYALSRVLISDLPADSHDLIYFRMGENQLRQGQFAQAMQSFQRVESSSKYFFQAHFSRGLAFLESNRPREAVPVFQNLLNLRGKAEVNDPKRVAALMALARSLYQAQEFEKSIDVYRRIPRDSDDWYDSLFESAWAYFRATKFRSVLSQFQSLHSAFYEEQYQPESLLLRSLVYLYICQFDEMEKTLTLFEKNYAVLRAQVHRFLTQNQDPVVYADEIIRDSKTQGLPQRVVKAMLREGDVRRSFEYLKKIVEEHKRTDVFAGSGFQAYAKRALEQRLRNARSAMGELIQFRLRAMLVELDDLIEQAAFAKYEMIGGRKEQLKKRIAGSGKQVDQNLSRSYYIQNGFEYWPFKGEYWLDELGNYQYVGRSTCE